MRKIYKYDLFIEEAGQIIEIAVSTPAKPLTVQRQGDYIRLWCEVPTDPIGLGAIRLLVAGTGYTYIPDNAVYLSSVQEDEYMWHIYVLEAS